MRVLVVGGGGREHALCHALARSPRLTELLCAPGNAGTAGLAENVPVAATDRRGLIQLCADRAVDLVVVGPEAPLVEGLADELRAEGVATVGPSAAAARLEGSKAFANAFMARHGIPTAASRTFTEFAEAEAHVVAGSFPLVLKADGLAAGKGVVIAETAAEARAALREMMQEGAFGRAGRTVVVEEFMAGEEASVFALSDGRDFVLLPPAQDHKRLGEGDVGPNTGGMGAYAPAPAVTPAVLREVEDAVVRPALRGMASEGMPYKGVLYVGLMLTAAGPRVVEFNCRFGDPEAQVLLPLLDTDALELFEALAHERLGATEVRHREGAAACVVLASEGYPGSYPKGRPIQGLDAVPDDAPVFHAGTARNDADEVVTAGGRVLGVTGLGSDLQAALDRAYAAADAIRFEGMQLRRDIGQKGLRRLAGEA